MTTENDQRDLAVWQQKLQGDIWLVGVRGRLDHMFTPQLDGVLDQLILNEHYWLVVDLDEATYINSGGLRSLVSGWRRVRPHGGEIHLCSLNSRLQEIFEMVGFQHIFNIHATQAEAIQALLASRDA